jgi:hypothetical protein
MPTSTAVLYISHTYSGNSALATVHNSSFTQLWGTESRFSIYCLMFNIPKRFCPHKTFSLSVQLPNLLSSITYQFLSRGQTSPYNPVRTYVYQTTIYQLILCFRQTYGVGTGEYGWSLPYPLSLHEGMG